MRMYLVSNMYPSKTHLRYGIFVKHFEEAVKDDFEVKLLVLTKAYGISKALAYLGIYLKLFWVSLKIRKDDTLYIHFPLYFGPLLNIFKRRQCDIVLNFHGSDAVFDRHYKRILANVLKKSIKKCRVVVPSNHYKLEIIRIFDVEENRIFIYPSGGVDATIFHPSHRKNKIFTIGFVGNFIDNKGWRVFLEALEILTDYHKFDYKAIMVGDGPCKDRIKQFIKDQKLNVELFAPVEQSELSKIYGMLDVFIFPTKRESLGLVGLEALMCGVPVIASNVEGPKEYIFDGLNGYLFESEEPSELSKGILKFAALTDSAKTKMVENAISSAQPYEKNDVRKTLLNWLKNV